MTKERVRCKRFCSVEETCTAVYARPLCPQHRTGKWLLQRRGALYTTVLHKAGWIQAWHKFGTNEKHGPGLDADRSEGSACSTPTPWWPSWCTRNLIARKTTSRPSCPPTPGCR